MFLQTPRATRYTNSVEKGLKKLTCIVTVTTTVKQLFTQWAPDKKFPRKKNQGAKIFLGWGRLLAPS